MKSVKKVLSLLVFAAVLIFSFSGPTVSAALPLAVLGELEVHSENGCAVLTWRPEPGADGYRIRRTALHDSGDMVSIMLDGGTASSWTDRTVDSGIEYSYSVTPFVLKNGNYIYGQGMEVNVLILSAAVTQFTAVGNGAGANLIWTPAKGADGYILSRNDGSGWVQLAAVNGDDTMYSDETGTVGAVYDYSIVAFAVKSDGTRIETEAAHASVTVYPNITSVSIAGIDRMKPGQSWRFDISIEPLDTDEPVIWVSDNEQVATVADGVVSGHSDGVATITALGVRSGVSASLQVEVNSDLIQIALTFDDGPAPGTMQLLEVLDECGVKCTFFMCGYQLDNHPESLVKMAEDGHELGYHTWDHQHQRDLSNYEIRLEYENFQQALTEVCGRPATIWRCPWGESTPRIRSCIDLPECTWTSDTLDWLYKDADRTYRQIMKMAVDGAIILCHDLHMTTVEGAIRAVRELSARGDVQFLTATQMLSRNGEEPEMYVRYP